jgi:diacylglycerol kinase (ATP)
MSAVRIFIRSMKYAWNGVVAAAVERSFRIHIAIALLTCAAGVVLQISRVEWLIVLLCFGLVMSMEAMNSAIERLVDFVCPHQDPRAGKIKDISAGAVLIASAIAAIIGVIIFTPYVITLFSTSS